MFKHAQCDIIWALQGVLPNANGGLEYAWCRKSMGWKMKPACYWVWVLGICYAIGIDVAHAADCSPCYVEDKNNDGRYLIYIPDRDTCKCDKTGKPDLYACKSGYYLDDDASAGCSMCICIACPAVDENGVSGQSADKNRNGIRGCYAQGMTNPGNPSADDSPGYKIAGYAFKYAAQCYYGTDTYVAPSA